MLHLTASRVDGHGIVALTDSTVPQLLVWVIQSMKERGWAGAVVRIVTDTGEEVFNAVVPATMPKEPPPLAE